MAVSISGTSGTWSHGNTVTISGSGFGTRAIATPRLFDLVNNQGYPSTANGIAVPVGGSYFWEEARDTYFSSVARVLGKPTYTANSVTGYLDTNAAQTKTGYAYLSWWFMAPTGVSYSEAHSSKVVRLSDSRSLTDQTLSWTQYQFYIYDTVTAGGTVYNSYAGFSSNAGQWCFVEVWFNTATQQVVARKNGVIQVSGSYVPSTADMNILWKLGWDSGGVSPVSLQWYIDAIYWDSSLCRAMLGNASTYAACTSFDMQKPTSWATNSAQIQVNTGAWTNGQKAYLYVFDATGTPNSNGFEITINSGSTVIAPVANFSGVPTSGQAPLLVSYSDLSTNTPTSWAWNFGANASPATATTQNPSTTYAYGGAKNVTLTATNSAGSDDETKNGYISARYLKPTNFGAS